MVISVCPASFLFLLIAVPAPTPTQAFFTGGGAWTPGYSSASSWHSGGATNDQSHGDPAPHVELSALGGEAAPLTGGFMDGTPELLPCHDVPWHPEVPERKAKMWIKMDRVWILKFFFPLFQLFIFVYAMFKFYHSPPKSLNINSHKNT